MMSKGEYNKLATEDTLEDVKNKEIIEKRLAKVNDFLQSLQKKLTVINDGLTEMEIAENFYKKKQKKEQRYEQILNEFLNERINYTDIQLEVNQQKENIHKSCGKTMIKHI